MLSFNENLKQKIVRSAFGYLVIIGVITGWLIIPNIIAIQDLHDQSVAAIADFQNRSLSSLALS